MVLLALTALAGPVEWRAEVGGEFNADSHGIVSLGLRRGPWSIELLTDTLDLRYAPEGDRGRWWTAGRVEIGAAGLMISPWTDGAPDPGRSMMASYIGVEGGGVRYLPAGAYAGGAYAARFYWFDALARTAVPVRADEPVLTLDALVGWWRPWGQAWARAGADFRFELVSPHVSGFAEAAPSWVVAPVVAVRAGWAEGQDDVNRTRLGGLNPYVVPVAGAAWAEYWVEDYVAGRGGVAVRIGPASVTGVADVAYFDGSTAFGTGVLGRIEGGRAFVDAAFGYTTAERQPGVAPISVYALAGLAWGTGGFRKDGGP